MTRRIHCAKLGREADGLTHPPLPGELGKRIYEHISAEVWQQWVDHQTMLINEHRLSMANAQSRAFLMQEMEKFLFGDGSDKPVGYVPEK